MSGGSLNYLCREAKYGNLVSQWESQIREALERLERVPETEDACDEIRTLLAMIADVEHRGFELADLFEAIEWTMSGDWGEDSIVREVEARRKARAAPPASPAPCDDAALRPHE